MGWILDFPATGAGQIAAEQWLQHQDKGIALTSLKFLLQDVGGYRPHLRNRYWHRCAYTLGFGELTRCPPLLVIATARSYAGLIPLYCT